MRKLENSPHITLSSGSGSMRRTFPIPIVYCFRIYRLLLTGLAFALYEDLSGHKNKMNFPGN